MTKQMRLVVAGASLLAVALLVWALLIHPPATPAEPATTDKVSTFSQPGARGNGAASGKSGRADSRSTSPRGGSATSGTNGAVADVSTASTGAGAASSGTRSGGAAPTAPLESVTVGPTYDASDTDVSVPVLLSPLVPRPLSRPRLDAPDG